MGEKRDVEGNFSTSDIQHTVVNDREKSYTESEIVKRLALSAQRSAA